VRLQRTISHCFLVCSAMLFTAVDTDAAVITATVTDPSFEATSSGDFDVVNNDTDASDNFSGWFEEVGNASSAVVWAEFVKSESDSNAPNTPDGVVWGALGTQGLGRLYQAIGTYEQHNTVTVSFTAADLTDKNFDTLMVELWVGGTAASAADGTALGGGGVGAALVGSFTTTGPTTNGATVTVSDTIDTGTVGTSGDTLWLAFHKETVGTVQAFDSVDVSAVPEPSSLCLTALGLLWLIGVGLLHRRRRS